jgi:MSHA biogenesis protein MshQ
LSPVGGVTGTLTVINNVTATDTRLLTVLNYNELERIQISGAINNFWNGLGTGSVYNYAINAVDVGEFVASHIQVSSISDPTWSSLTSNIYQGMSTSLTGAEYEVRAYGNSNIVLANYDNTLPTFANSSADPLVKDSITAGVSVTGGALQSELVWTTSDTVPDDNDHINLSATFNNVIWEKRTGLPTSDDLPTLISAFELPPSFFNDGNGTCIQVNAASACSTTNETLSLNATQTLSLARVSVPDQIDASSTSAYIPVTLETLTAVNTVGVVDQYTFETNTAESALDSTIISGASYGSGACTLDPATTCSPVASSANGTLRDNAGNLGSIAQGEGNLLMTGSNLSGVLEADITVPNWLEWYWNDLNGDGDINALDLSRPSTFVLFGEYQGRAPILFIRPGFR